MNLRMYEPESWVYHTGAKKRFQALKKKGLPSIKGWKMITLTCNPELFLNAKNGYEIAKKRLRKFMWCLKVHHGISELRYFWKLEFTAEGWPHWHIALDYRPKLDVEYIRKRWNLGRTNVVHCSTNHNYLLKYLVKSGELPGWVLDYEGTMRFFQSSNIFAPEKKRGTKNVAVSTPSRTPLTIRQKLARWDKKATAIWTYKQRQFHIVLMLKEDFNTVYRKKIQERSPQKRALQSIVVDHKTLNITYEWILEQCQISSQNRLRELTQKTVKSEQDYSLRANVSQRIYCQGRDVRTKLPTGHFSPSSQTIRMFSNIAVTQ